MDLRRSLFLATALTVAAAGGACASGGGGGDGGGGTTMDDIMARAGGEELPQGESPRENEFTEAAEDALEEAEEAGTPTEARQHYQTAMEAARQAVSMDERNPLAHLLLARAAVGLEDYQTAGEAYDRAEELRPVYRLQTEGAREQHWIELYQEASPMVSSGEYEQAIEIMEDADAIYDRRPEVMITLGQLYASTGRTEDAVEVLREAQALIDSPRIEEMDSATAAEWQAQAAQIPDIITQALLQGRQYEAAAEELRQLVAENPDNLQYLQLLGNVYAQTEQPDSARKIFLQLMERDLGPRQYYQMGVGFYQMEDWENAAEAFSQAAEGAPMDRDAIEMWARSVQIANQETEGEVPPARRDALVEAAERWVELDPYSRNGLLILAQTENQRGNEDRAREIVQRIESLPVAVTDLQFRPRQGGGGTVSGSVENVSASAGDQVTLEFTFYDLQGQSIGNASAQVSVPAEGAREVFQVEAPGDQEVGGYAYEVSM